MNNDIIEVKNLIKVYIQKKKNKLSKSKILNNISFSVKKGEVFGLLGPNGAGKTTTFKILTTLLAPTSGEVKILGKDVMKNDKEIRKEINFIFGGEKGVYHQLTAIEYLTYFCILYSIPKNIHQKKIIELITLVGLENATQQKISTFSKGMIQRLHIARALLNDPKIIFLDEPTIGLDPIGAKMLRNIVKNLSKKGITIILTTHYMKEAEELCDRIAFIKQGEIIEHGTKSKILEKYKYINNYKATILLNNKIDLSENLIINNIELTNIKENYNLLNFSSGSTYSQIKDELSKYSTIIKLEKREVSLEDIYIELIKEKGDLI